MPRRNLSKEADGEKTAIAVGEVISEAVAEENSVADSPSKIHILEGRNTSLWKTISSMEELCIIALKVLKMNQNGDLADGSLGPAPIVAYPSLLS